MQKSEMEQISAGYFSEEINKRDKVRAECEERGLHWARSCVGTRSDGEIAQFMTEWIDEVETRERQKLESRQIELAERSVIAAEHSAQAAGSSAKSSAGSTKAAVASAAFAFFALVVSIVAYFK